MENNTNKLFKQRLFRMHVSAGITFSLLFYISIFFGIFAILLPYIQVWENPSRHFEQKNIYTINYESMLEKVLQDPDFPRSNIILTLPGNMGDPALKISHQFAKGKVFNPKNKNELTINKDKSQLADFLNWMHYGRPLKLFGIMIFGFTAVGIMFVILTGVFLINILSFKNNGKNKKSLFSKIHIKIFTWVSPPLLVITLTGAMMNIGLGGAGPMSYILSKGEVSSIDALVGPVLFKKRDSVKRLNQKAKMLPIKDLLIKAHQINPDIDFKSITLINWKDKSARVLIKGYNPYKPFLNGGIFNKPSITLNAINSDLIQDKKVMDSPWSVHVAESVFFLHFLFGVDIFTRLFIVILMLAACIALAFGMLLSFERKSNKTDEKGKYYKNISKLTLAVMIGILPPTGSLFLFQWILPFDLDNRVFIQQIIFLIIWSFTFFCSFYINDNYKIAKNMFLSAGILFFISPFTHFIFSGFSPLTLITKGLNNILALDLLLLFLGIVFLTLSKILPENKKDSEIFWLKKKYKL